MPQKKAYLLDTNIILRFLLEDHPVYSTKAKNFFKEIYKNKSQAIILESVLAECVFVLEKFYNVPKDEIYKKLLEILEMEGIVNTDKSKLRKSLDIYVKKNVDIVDAILAGKSSKTHKVISWDEDIKRITSFYKIL